jgi:hypothetical protein
MRNPLDEVYCAQIRTAGSHGKWEPDTRVSPGDYGIFRRGVFQRWASLRSMGFAFGTSTGPPSLTNVKTSGIREASSAGRTAGSDPLEAVLAGEVRLKHDVGGSDEVLLLTRRGRWRELRDVGALLTQLRANFVDIPLPCVVICSVYETSGGVVGISSRSTASFEIGVDGRGGPTIGVIAAAGTENRKRGLHSARRAFSLWPVAAEESELPADGSPGVMRYTPLFNLAFRIRKRWWGRFGRAILCDANGNPVSALIDRADPADLLYDARRAELSPSEVRSLPIDELFEDVTPELLSEEVLAETGPAAEDDFPTSRRFERTTERTDPSRQR